MVPICCLLAMLPPSRSRSFAKRKPSNSSGLGYTSPSVWIALSGAATTVPAGTVMPLENVNGRNAIRTSTTSRTVSATETEGQTNKLNQCLDHPDVEFLARNCQSCTFCPIQLSSTLPQPRRLQLLDEEVRCTLDWKEGGTMLA